MKNHFTPIKFDKQLPFPENHFFVYYIWNSEKDIYYIGISRNPHRRINQNLIDKANIKEDFLAAVTGEKQNPAAKNPFRFGILGLKNNKDEPKGYPNAFLGCIAEALYMLHLENMGIALYNRDKFGGHAELKHRRPAFEAVLKIIDPALRGHPTDAEMANLEEQIGEIRTFVNDTNGKDVINHFVLDELDKAWDEYCERKKRRGFGRTQTMPLIAFNPEQNHPLRPAANDNFPETANPAPDPATLTP